MAYRFGNLVLEPGRQLLADGVPVALRRKPLDIMTALARAGGDLVTKDELIAAVWPGRIVEEGALHVHIVTLRKAMGAEAGRLKTVHGLGYRLEVDGAGPVEGFSDPATGPSIAVLPLRIVGQPGSHAMIAEALPHEMIAELSRLRWLFVIARSSSFQFRDPDPDIARIRETLGVGYCLSGTLEHSDGRIAITLDLVDTASGRVVWGNRYGATAAAIQELRATIVADIVAELDFQIPVHEAHRASLLATESLDAWGCYHLALQRMFRSTPADNAAAAALFERAVKLDPAFARAHAGLSFTSFQNAFMHYVGDAASAAVAARRSSERALELDAGDAFANLVHGRSLWLTGDLAGSLGWIERALRFNPNYAQAAYAHAFADAMLCHGESGQLHADRALALSPIDPMHYAMLGSRALSHAVRSDYDRSADWADRAARSPNSHEFIAMIAVACNAMAGRDEQARGWAETVRARRPELGRDHFFAAFPFEKVQIRDDFASALRDFGF